MGDATCRARFSGTGHGVGQGANVRPRPSPSASAALLALLAVRVRILRSATMAEQPNFNLDPASRVCTVALASSGIIWVVDTRRRRSSSSSSRPSRRNRASKRKCICSPACAGTSASSHRSFCLASFLTVSFECPPHFALPPAALLLALPRSPYPRRLDASARSLRASLGKNRAALQIASTASWTLASSS